MTILRIGKITVIRGNHRPALYDKIRSLSDLDIYNSYGPAETTVHSNTRIILRDNIMSVGRQLYNVQCDIRDIDGKVLPDSVVGEHYIGGYGVSMGHHNQPEKTATAYLTLGSVPYFRSGDFAYKLPNGEIVVLGRRDGQIKLRSLRIEIGEIEQSMLAKGGKMPGAQRLVRRPFYYFDNDYADLLGGRLMVAEGEITDASSLEKLDGPGIDTVFNCAASVKHFSAGSDIYDTNVLGVGNVLDYAKRNGAGLVHISTTSTAGEILLDGRHERFVYDERTLFKGQALDNQYLSSKFLAERLVLAAAAEGQDAKIIRVGNLMACDADGIFQINFRTNGFINRQGGKPEGLDASWARRASAR